MDRRKFISTLIGGVAASAAVRTFPFRVFSFPSKIETGDWKGIHIDSYPGILQTPYYGRGCAITPEMIQRAIAREQARRLLGI